MEEELTPHDSYHHGDLRQALLGAALELIREKGVEGLSLRGVARRAGVSHMAPYHHFDNRAALVAAVAEEGFVLLREAMQKRMNGIEDPSRRLQASGLGYVLFAVEHEAHFRVMYSAEVADKSVYPSLQAASEAAYAVLTEAIIACQERKLIREMEPEMLSRTAWALVHGLAMLLIDRHLQAETETGAEMLAREVTSVLWEGLGSE